MRGVRIWTTTSYSGMRGVRIWTTTGYSGMRGDAYLYVYWLRVRGRTTAVSEWRAEEGGSGEYLTPLFGW
eukprot:5589336-Pyramimonas_sp.AAC.1